jgi:hypothetical protein
MRFCSLQRCEISFLLIGLGVAMVEPALAGTAGKANQAARSWGDSADSAAKLVPQLGSELFSIREATTNQLMQMGIAIKPVLVAALDDSDAEIRMRARRILTTVVDADFQHRLALFAEDVRDARHYDLPGWSRFRKLVGSDRAARNLFVEMQRAEPNLMVAFEAGQEPAARMLETRIRFAQAAFQGRIGFSSNGLSVGSIAALLFVGSDKSINLADDYALQLGNLPYYQPFQSAIVAGQQSELLKKILGPWIARDASQTLIYQNLYLAMRFNLKEGLDPAIRLLQQPGAVPQVKPLALLAISKFGGKEHLPLVEPFMRATDLCAQVDVNGIRYVTQVRDVALFASLRLAGQEPKGYGFTRVPPNDQLLYQIANFGFRTDLERDEAFKKWSEWRTANHQPHAAAKSAPSKS